MAASCSPHFVTMTAVEAAFAGRLPARPTTPARPYAVGRSYGLGDADEKGEDEGPKRAQGHRSEELTISVNS